MISYRYYGMYIPEMYDFLSAVTFEELYICMLFECLCEDVASIS